MSNIDKQALTKVYVTKYAPPEVVRELARIALASLEAEPVAEVCEGFTLRYIGHGPAPKSGVRIGDRLYGAPPALVANAYPLLEFVKEYIESWDLGMAGDSGLLASAKQAIADSTIQQPAPVVTDERASFNAWNNDTDCPLAGLTVKQAAWLAWLKRSGTIKSFGNDEELEPVSNRDELPEEKGSSLQLRNLIRQRHAEWSEKTFGNVGPVGPLKHLSKEALEAAAEPDDLSEWADMQFLLWDAQRRAGICDGEITAAMEEKLKVNMARQWPEPKDGEPRMHIKEAGNSPVIPDGYALVPIVPTEDMVINGFESEPDEDFSDPDVWEEYQSMSGCQQAALRAKLCWEAMVAAAPKQGE